MENKLRILIDNLIRSCHMCGFARVCTEGNYVCGTKEQAIASILKLADKH